MHRLRFTPSAIKGIEDIGEYTQTNWGINQRNKYLDALDVSFNALAANPNLGKDCSHIAIGIRRYPKGSHVVYYRIEDDFVTIIRILHERMEPTLHFE